MLKTTFLITNFIGLLFFGWLSDDDVLIQNNTPAVIGQGQKTLVEVVVNKGAVQGFSKMELNLPAGLTATPGEIKGGSFTFSGQKALFVWMDMPKEESFTVTYYIEAAPNMEGSYEVAGTFSYVKDNKREDIKLPAKSIQVVKETMPTPEQVAQSNPGVKIEEEVVEMVCERTFTKISENEYVVNVEVRNNKVQNTLARILETMPDGCEASVENNGGATVTSLGNTIKFVWFQAPDATSFGCSYRMTCVEPLAAPAISGEFSYTYNDDPYKMPIVNNGEMPADAVLYAPVSSLPAPDTSDKGESTAKNDPTPPKKETPKPNERSGDEVAENRTTSIPSPETGITYKVQILAAHRVVNKTFMKKTYQFSEAYNIENHEGWVKYTTGKYKQYSDARDARERVKSDYVTLPGPFVTAYNDGERITVQEALLISQQSWIK